ncbi:MAG: hypothetical protein KDC38_07860, partial [Planctomycetes bacterium]|nr:hypothetical protein [Planctomycetota bacterium]
MTLHPKILGCAAVEPPFVYHTDQIRPYLLEWLRSRDPVLAQRAEKIIESVRIERRGSVVCIDDVFEAR